MTLSPLAPSPTAAVSSWPSVVLLGLVCAIGCTGDKDDADATPDDPAPAGDAGESSGDGGVDGGDDGSGDAGAGDGGTSDWTPPEGGVVELVTDDGVTLVADYTPVDQEGAAAVVLLHMIPPSWDRTSWPTDFVSALHDQGWAVIAPDRRGAGDSGGEAREAYTGPNGKLDAAACVDRLRADGYDDIAIIGASNGTTTALDYTLWARAEGRPVPVALGFMTGGSYTEAQSAMADLGAEVPAVFTFSTEERAWSVTQQGLERASWVFHEYPSGDHGTQMFRAAPEVADDLVAFLAATF